METKVVRNTRGQGESRGVSASARSRSTRWRFAVGGVSILLLAGCASSGRSSRFWPHKEQWRAALHHAARSPATWVPAAAAAAVAAGGWDGDISDWARRETPLFGSEQNAHRASDALLAASQVGLIATAIAVPAQDPPAPSRFERFAWEEIGVLAASGLTEGVKDLSARERPNGSSDLSFPSGHATVAAAAATLAAQNLRLTRLSPGARRGLTAGLATIAVGTSWARVEAGAHYPTDVLAGAALGDFVSLLVHDAFLGSSTSPLLSFELGPSRRAVVVRVAF